MRLRRTELFREFGGHGARRNHYAPRPARKLKTKSLFSRAVRATRKRTDFLLEKTDNHRLEHVRRDLQNAKHEPSFEKSSGRFPRAFWIDINFFLSPR